MGIERSFWKIERRYHTNLLDGYPYEVQAASTFHQRWQAAKLAEGG